MRPPGYGYVLQTSGCTPCATVTDTMIDGSDQKAKVPFGAKALDKNVRAPLSFLDSLPYLSEISGAASNGGPYMGPTDLRVSLQHTRHALGPSLFCRL